jgi:hypothetical protein
MLPWENHRFVSTQSKHSLGIATAGLNLASDFSFCFQFQVGSSLVSRRPMESTRITGHWGNRRLEKAPMVTRPRLSHEVLAERCFNRFGEFSISSSVIASKQSRRLETGSSVEPPLG